MFVIFAARIIEMVKRDDQASIPVMVFCNDIPTCDWLSRLLEENNVRVLRLHGSNSNPEVIVIKEELHPKPKLSMFCVLPKNNQLFFED